MRAQSSKLYLSSKVNFMTTTAAMKQINFSAYGGADVLQITDVAIPRPQAGQVLVKVLAAGVNFSDVLRRRNTYFQTSPLPYVPGAEAVGIIESVGDGVQAPFEVGTRVLAILPFGGGYAEYAIGIAQYCVPLPEPISNEAAAAIFVQGSTAYLLASHVAGSLVGKSVLVHAAAGGVGSLLVQLVKLLGAKMVVATASVPSKLQQAKQLGADEAISYMQLDWATQAIAANNNERFDVIFEMVGGEVFNHSIQCLAAGGSVVVYGAASGLQGTIHPEHFVDENQSLIAFNLAYYIEHHTALWGQALQAVIGLMVESKLKVLSPDVFSLADAAKAHLALENRQTIGKVILKP